MNPAATPWTPPTLNTLSPTHTHCAVALAGYENQIQPVPYQHLYIVVDLARVEVSAFHKYKKDLQRTYQCW